MDRITLSRQSFNTLVASIVNLEDSQFEILDYYFPAHDRERMNMQSLITNYIERINAIMERITVVDDTEFNKFPVVVIGSKIIMEDLESKSKSEFRLIAPLGSAVSEGDVSIFSPIGKAILLKENNSIVEYDAPGGSFAFQIQSISL